jgi:hypothetical protein
MNQRLRREFDCHLAHLMIDVAKLEPGAAIALDTVLGFTAE